ncbi:MAG: hypothetical protein WBA00_04275 [Rhodococcus sp. (in: high G+C Gram-positive bacteria)]
MTTTETRRGWTADERRKVRAAAAAASIKLREYDKDPVARRY